MGRYLNQKATLGRAVGLDGFGRHEKESVVIDCRIEERARVAYDAHGNEALSGCTLFTLDEVSIKDTIDGKPVISVTKMVGVDGKVLCYEVLI